MGELLRVTRGYRQTIWVRTLENRQVDPEGGASQSMGVESQLQTTHSMGVESQLQASYSMGVGSQFIDIR